MLLLLATALAGDLRVLGGTEAAPGAWPEAAALFQGEQFRCSGVLVAPRIVLTAGHCGTDFDRVVLSSVDLAEPVEEIGVERAVRRGDYWSTYDVTAAVLTAPATTPPRPILRDCLADWYLTPGATGAIVGWGATDAWGLELGTTLREALVAVWPCDDPDRGCNEAVLPAGELLAGGGGVDTCVGDSGGPLYVLAEGDAWVAGITSRGAAPSDTPCGDGGIYVRVDAVADWIEAETGLALSRPECGDWNRRPAPTAGRLTVAQWASGSTVIAPNDPDAGDRHSFRVTGRPEAGDAVVDPDGTLTYTADDLTGLDRIVVTVTDDGSPPLSAEVAVEVVVEAAPEPPKACGCGGGRPVGAPGLLVLALARRRRATGQTSQSIPASASWPWSSARSMAH